MRHFLSVFGKHSPLYDELNERASAYAAQKGFSYQWAPQDPYNKQEVIELLKNCDVGLIDVEPYDESVFSHINQRCKLLVRFGVGYDQVNLADATKSGICITRTAGANAPAVAEMAFTMILALRRKLAENRKIIESGQWERLVVSEMIGKTVGIVGFGAIGQTLTKLLSGFDCKVLAYDPYPNLEKMAELNVENCSLEKLVQESDAISIHVPYNASTHHMFDAEMISKMKSDAVLICTARGNLVDEDALYEALTKKQIGGAGLDVFAQEPLPNSSKLIGLDNLILTPHTASQTIGSLWAIYKMAIDIAYDFFAGEQIAKANLLNPDYNQK